MASGQAKANMDYDARNRLAAVTAVLSERFGVAAVAPRNAYRDADLERIYQTEDIATYLEGLEVATRPAKVEAKKADEPVKADKKAEPVKADSKKSEPVTEVAKKVSK